MYPDEDDMPQLAKQVLDYIRTRQGLGTNEQALYFWSTLSDEEKLEYFNLVAKVA